MGLFKNVDIFLKFKNINYFIFDKYLYFHYYKISFEIRYNKL